MMLTAVESIVQWWVNIIFTLGVLIFITMDMFLTRTNYPAKMTTRIAIGWSGFWFLVAIAFNILLWLHLYHTKSLAVANELSLAFFTGYIVEELISLENMFVIFVLCKYFNLPHKYKRHTLFYAVIGAMFFRLMMVMCSVWLIEHLHWIIYIFGIFLVACGIRIIFLLKTRNVSFSHNRLHSFILERFNVTKEYEGRRFFINKDNKLFVTPLFVIILMILITDLIFATISIPTIFGITSDPFIVYSSNVLAILGLRSMYYLFENLENQFYLLRHCVPVILIYIGTKMLISPWVVISVYLNLGIIVSIILIMFIASWIQRPKISA